VLRQRMGGTDRAGDGDPRLQAEARAQKRTILRATAWLCGPSPMLWYRRRFCLAID
jgi:hypothetical protein